MSLFRYLFDHDWFQRADIIRLEEENKGLSNRMDFARDDTRRLEDRIAALETDAAQMALFNKTLLRMMVEKQVCAPQEFTNLLRMLDLQDGVKDGKVTAALSADAPPSCPRCRRPLPRNKPRCMYCG
jgi:hypothetical protein